MALGGPGGYAEGAERLMRNPSILVLAAALAASAARAQSAFDLISLSAMENRTPPSGLVPAGVRVERDLAHNRDFLVDGRQNAVAIDDFTEGRTTAFVSLDKTEDPVVRAYLEFLASRRVTARTAGGLSALSEDATGGGPSLKALGLEPQPAVPGQGGGTTKPSVPGGGSVVG